MVPRGQAYACWFFLAIGDFWETRSGTTVTALTTDTSDSFLARRPAILVEPRLRILVPFKHVPDPDHHDQIRVSPDGTTLDASHLESKPNPFDHYALEAALRLTEDGREPRRRRGEVVVATVGPPEADPRLRNALATGADEALRLEANDAHLDGRLVAHALGVLVREVEPDLVLLGKQAVDGDNQQVGQFLAARLGWPMATAVSVLHEQEDGTLLVHRPVDGGVVRLRIALPAVVSVDLGIVAPRAVYSRHTDPAYEYGEGVRFASLLAVRQAQRKQLATRPLTSVVPNAKPVTQYRRFVVPPNRRRRLRVADVTELLKRLVEARVI